MLSVPAVDLTFDDDEWKTPPIGNKFYRAASVGSWAVTSIGRGFDWDGPSNDKTSEEVETTPPYSLRSEFGYASKALDTTLAPKQDHASVNTTSKTRSITPTAFSARTSSTTPTIETFMVSPLDSRTSSPSITSSSCRPTPSRSTSSPRPRRRSSRQRISLIAGRVSIIPLESPSPSYILPQSLRRSGSSISVAASTRAPSPAAEKESFLGNRSISDFHIEGEIGRGAYGLVKRGREIHPDGSLGVSFPAPGLS